MQLKGAMVAMVTPFVDGNVDYEGIDRLTDMLIDGGIEALVPCGTTGESPTLSHEEQDLVIARVVQRAAGRVPVIAGTGSNSTSEAVQLTQHAKDSGADACLIVNPYYNKPTQCGMLKHFEAIDAVGLPMVLYNIPGRSGVELDVETVLEAYNSFEQVIAIKEATGKLDNTSALAAQCDITILSGDDALTLPIMACGGSGVISVIGNLLPKQLRALTDMAASGDMAAATKKHLELYSLFKGMFAETNPIPIKAAMAMAGLIQDELRLPMTSLDDQYRGELRQLLMDAGVELV